MIRLTIEELTKPMKKANLKQANLKADLLSFAVDLDKLTVTVNGTSIALDRINGTKGGDRWFWLCPACGKRVRVLYGSLRAWSCGACSGYLKQTLNRTKNSVYYFDQAMKIAYKVDPTFKPRNGYIDYDFPSRPKYMRAVKYWELYRRYLRIFQKGLDYWLSGR